MHVMFVGREPALMPTFRNGLAGALGGDSRPGGLLAGYRALLKGDARRTVAAMIAAADEEKPALRLALGSTAYSSISRALSQRLAAIETQRDVAFSADRD